MRDKALATVVLAGAIGFLLPLYEFLGKINNWEVINKPEGVANLTWCVICGLLAIAAALGIDVKNLIPSFITDFLDSRRKQ